MGKRKAPERVSASIRGGRLTVDGPDQDGDYDIILQDSLGQQETEMFLTRDEANKLILALHGKVLHG